VADFPKPLPDGDDQRAVLVALELLRRSVADLPLGIARQANQLPGEKTNPFGTPRPAGGGYDFASPGANPAQANAGRTPAGVAIPGRERVGDALDTLGRRFAAVAGPLAVLGATVSASTSGFSVLGTAVRVLATTLAPILLPVVVAVATGLVTLADKIEPFVQEILPKWAAFVLDHLIPAFEYAADVIVGFAETARDVIGVLGDVADFALDAINPFGGAVAAAVIPGGRPERDTGAGDFDYIDPARRGRLEGDSGAALRDVLRSLRVSTGPRAQTSGLSDAARSAQLAALNADPLEARMLRTLEKTLSTMERVARGVEKIGGGGGAEFRGDF